MVSIRFRALTANSRQIRTAGLVNGFRNAQTQWAKGVKAELVKYPPPIPSSSYVRTGDLGRGWQITGPNMSPSGLVTRVNNSVEYVGWVYGDEAGEGQAAVHEGRWPLIAEVVDREGYLRLLREVVEKNVG